MVKLRKFVDLVRSWFSGGGGRGGGPGGGPTSGSYNRARFESEFNTAQRWNS